ncbi:formylmethanofuran dehydrogenase subunit B [Phyllobacterium sp. CL33Tsu]|nr:formylmethanofuran dehydrogenase subunit B [Phyllobacterium sp. CL33Tsu]
MRNMSVAWIGSQPVSLMDAIQNVAKLLVSSRCPVFTIDADVHGTRSAIALAERVGGAFDHIHGDTLAREVALFADQGAMITTPGETRRRSSLVVLVGDIPVAHHELLLHLAGSGPDLGDRNKRVWFHVEGALEPPSDAGRLHRKLRSVAIGGEGLGLSGVLAALRADLLGRNQTGSLANVDRLKSALGKSRFPVFVFSGTMNSPDLAMLQGLVADLNKQGRASSLFLPTDDDAWGTALTSLWMTGFPPRTGFSDSLPSYDPVRWDTQRMVRDKEADLHVWVSARGTMPPKGRIGLVSLSRTEKRREGAAVTISVGRAGVDHDGVAFSSRIGTFHSLTASAPSELPSIASVLQQLALVLPGRKGLPC